MSDETTRSEAAISGLAAAAAARRAESTPITRAQRIPSRDYDEHRDEYHGGHTCPDDWRACERRNHPKHRYAATAVTAPLVWHYLSNQGSGRGIYALCGEIRRAWMATEMFACPKAFAPCQTCIAVDACCPCERNNP